MGRSSSELSNLNEDWDSGMKENDLFFINKRIDSLRKPKYKF